MKKIFIILIFMWSISIFSQGLNNELDSGLDSKEQDNILNGRKLHFYKNGNLKSIENWKNGRLSGKFTIYLEDGTKIIENNYLDGKDHGTYLIFHENGNPYIKGYFSYGTPKKVWSYYDKTGKLKSQHTPNS